MNVRNFLIFVIVVVSINYNNVFAGTADAHTIDTVHYMANGEVIFWQRGSHNNPPNCPNLILNRWVIDGKTEGGKVQVSGLMSAYLSGKKIAIIGQGNCLVWPDTETVGYFYTID